MKLHSYRLIVLISFSHYGHSVPPKILQQRLFSQIMVVLGRNGPKEEWVGFFIGQVMRGCTVTNLLGAKPS